MKPIHLIAAVISLIFCAVSATAQSDYRIRSGDTLQIEVLEDSSLNRSVVVLPNGQISFPFAGTVQAGGRTIAQIESTIRSAISANFANPPTVFVGVQPNRERTGTGTGRSISIYFLGEVNEPGLVKVKRGTTLLQAIAVSGGLSKYAATKRIQLRRTNSQSGVQGVTTLNYKALANGASSNDIELRDGDVILVPERRLFE